MQSPLYQWYWKTIDWLFPPTCGGCNKLGVRWCSKCQKATKLIKAPYCERCGIHISSSGLCVRCKEFFSHVAAIRSWAVFDGPVRQAIHRIKYHQDLALASIFAKFLGDFYRDQMNWHIDIVIPVPLSSARKKQRGYNQAALLAKPLALELELPYKNQALKRMVDTRSQVGLSMLERRDNVANVFKASPIVANQSILVVDDVATSGSTLESCASTLKQAGAKVVYGMTLTRAVFAP